MLNMLEYARIFAYQTDMNLIGRDGRTDGRTDAQTTLVINAIFGVLNIVFATVHATTVDIIDEMVHGPVMGNVQDTVVFTVRKFATHNNARRSSTSNDDFVTC
jgi:histidyl-tRNA synthetase